MSGAIPPHPNTPSWCGAQLKHRDKFKFYLYLHVILYGFETWCSHHKGRIEIEGF
jgi:hypothetical protein